MKVEMNGRDEQWNLVFSLKRRRRFDVESWKLEAATSVDGWIEGLKRA